MEPHDIERTTFPVVRRGYDTHQVEAFLQAVAAQYRAALQAAEEAAQAAEEAAKAALAASSASQPFENVGSHVAAILASAAQAAEEMKVASEQEAETIRSAAVQEAAQTREQAKRELAAVQAAKAAVERETTAARAAIRDEAARIQQGARERAAAIEAEAKEAAVRIERTVRGNVEAILAASRSKYERLRAVQQRCVDRLASLESLIQEVRKEVPPDPEGDPFDGVQPRESLEVTLKDPPAAVTSQAQHDSGDTETHSSDRRAGKGPSTKVKTPSRRKPEPATERSAPE